MPQKKPLEPLIPLEQFKKLVAAIAQVPKEAVQKGAGSQKPLPPDKSST
jgi:hypothetical protein